MISLCLAFINPKLWIKSQLMMALVIYELQFLLLLVLDSWKLSDASLSSCSLRSVSTDEQRVHGCVKWPISGQVS